MRRVRLLVRLPVPLRRTVDLRVPVRLPERLPVDPLRRVPRLADAVRVLLRPRPPVVRRVVARPLPRVVLALPVPWGDCFRPRRLRRWTFPPIISRPDRLDSAMAR